MTIAYYKKNKKLIVECDECGTAEVIEGHNENDCSNKLMKKGWLYRFKKGVMRTENLCPHCGGDV